MKIDSWACVASVLVTMLVGTVAAQGVGPDVVREVVEVEAKVVPGDPGSLQRALVVEARGRVPTAGFTDVRLLPAVDRAADALPPADGILDLVFLARPPAGPAAQVVSDVVATAVIPDFDPGLGWIKGVRVHGLGEGVIERQVPVERALRVRKNILDLTPQELAAFEQGVAAMKSRPVTDRTSWAFQANIHGKQPTPPNDPLWRQCEHGTIHFLTWHRAYLLEFERIVREASGDPELTLPYWDWSTSRALPLPFRDPASPLHDPSRSINNGALIPASIVVDDLATATGSNVFTIFSQALEGSPHGAVHVQVGGNMGSVARSANDPIFWLHHCNIDRVWDEWIARGGGRTNPSAPQFLARTFTLARADGTTVTHRAGDLLVAADLGYRYDTSAAVGPPAPLPVARVRGMVAMHSDENDHMVGAPGQVVASSRPSGVVPAARQEAVKRLGLRRENVELTFERGGADALRATATRHAPGSAVIEVVGIAAKAAPRFTYEMFLNLPDGALDPEVRRLHRVGTLNLFGIADGDAHGDHAGGGHGAQGPRVLRLDANPTIRRLRDAGLWKDGSVRITLEPLTPVAASPQAEAELEQLLDASAAEADLSYDRIDLKIVEP